MTNEQIAQEFSVVSDFRAHHYLNPPDGAVPAALIDEVPVRYLTPTPTIRAQVLAAVPTQHYVPSWSIVRKVPSAIKASQVVAELWALSQQGKLDRVRKGTRWTYRRIAA